MSNRIDNLSNCGRYSRTHIWLTSKTVVGNKDLVALDITILLYYIYYYSLVIGVTVRKLGSFGVTFKIVS